MRIDESSKLILRVANEDLPVRTAPPTSEDFVAHDSNFQRTDPWSTLSSGGHVEGCDSERFQAPTEEAGQWSVHKDHNNKTYYLNHASNTWQYEKPDCLKKYDPRPSGSCVVM